MITGGSKEKEERRGGEEGQVKIQVVAVDPSDAPTARRRGISRYGILWFYFCPFLGIDVECPHVVEVPRLASDVETTFQ